MCNVKLLGAAVVNGPLCARNGHCKHLFAFIYREGFNTVQASDLGIKF